MRVKTHGDHEKSHQYWSRRLRVAEAEAEAADQHLTMLSIERVGQLALFDECQIIPFPVRQEPENIVA